MISSVKDPASESAVEQSNLDKLYNMFPARTLPFGILDNDWAHFQVDEADQKIIPDRLRDPFIPFLNEQIGGFEGKRVLELGPYEGFHTHALCKSGVKEVLAIEGNPRNFLKCLIVKNHYQLNAARFLVGDFTAYLEKTNHKFALILASGVLYHLARPMVLLDEITTKSPAIGICTTLYDPDNPTFHVTGRTREVTFEGTEPFLLHERTNRTALTRNSKQGLEKSAWLISREDLLRFLEYRNFEYTIFNGRKPKTGATRIRLFAKKRNQKQAS